MTHPPPKKSDALASDSVPNVDLNGLPDFDKVREEMGLPPRGKNVALGFIGADIFDDLAVRFLENARAQVLALKDAQDALTVRSGQPQTPLFKTIHFTAHKLAGSGGTFGYQKISDVAADIEQIAGDFLSGRSPLDEESNDQLLCLINLLQEIISAADAS